MKLRQILREDEELMNSYITHLEKGDKILMGKYRNKEAEIKGFSLDNHNQPVVHTNKGNRKLNAFRIMGSMPEESLQKKYQNFMKNKLKEFGKTSFKRLSSTEKRELSNAWKEEKEK